MEAGELEIGRTLRASYVYDADKRRIRKVVESATTKYFLDGMDVIADYDGSDALLASYVTPGLDANLSMTREGQTYYYMRDGLGSIRNLFDASENVANTYDYHAFGSALGEWSESVENRYTYTAREWDGESGQYYYRARYYMGGGRFNRRDPARDGINLYIYVGSTPTIFVDPAGLWKWVDGGRQGGARARVVATRDRDSYEALAELVGMDVDDIDKWLKPYKPQDKVRCGQEFSVPNSAYIDAAAFTWSPIFRLYLWLYKRDLTSDWEQEGLKVIYTNPRNTSVQTIKANLGSDDVYRYAYIGHGAEGVLTELSDSGKHPDYAIAPGIRLTKHGINEMHMLTCESASKMAEWQQNVAKTGFVILVDGLYTIYRRRYVITRGTNVHH